MTHTVIPANFHQGHKAYVMWQADSGSITESTDGIAAATLAALGGSPVLVGYTDMPQADQNLNNGIGYGIGTPQGLYKKFGRIEPRVTFNVKVGSMAFLADNCLRAEGSNLPYIALHVGISGQAGGMVFRKCKCSNVVFTFTGGTDGQARELTAQVTFEAMAVQTDGSTRTITPSQGRSFGQPMFWHDVQTFNIADAAGNTSDYRATLMGQTLTINHNIERKNERPNFSGGDSDYLSRTAYHLLEHNIDATGQTTFHTRVPQGLINGAANAQDWGDMAISIRNDAALPDPGTWLLTIVDAVPVVASQNGGDTGGEVDSTISMAAMNATLEFTADA